MEPKASAAVAEHAASPFRGPAADSALGELLINVLPFTCAVGHALELSHCLALCGATWRSGARRADGSLDRAGFLGGTNDMMERSLEQQAAWLVEARKKGREEGGWTQLMLAAIGGKEQRVRELVAAGAPIDLVANNGWSALHCASYFDRVRIIELLLDGKIAGKGTDINKQSKLGHPPLILATINNREAAVRLLLERGADVTPRDKAGHTLLSYAKDKPTNHALLVARGATE